MFNRNAKLSPEVDSYVYFGKKDCKSWCPTSGGQKKDCAWLGGFWKSLYHHEMSQVNN